MAIDLNPGRQQILDNEVKGQTLTSAIFKISTSNGDAMFSELAGISSEVEQVEYMEAGLKGPVFGRFIGRAKPPTVALKRAMSTNKDTQWIWEWHAMARTGTTAAYRACTLSLYAAGQDPSGTATKAYMLSNAFPTKVEIAGMKAGGSEVVLQTVTLMCDEIIEAP
jgi:phage tail-like protein